MKDEAPEFSHDTLNRFLTAEIPHLDGELRLERITGGQSNPTFFVTYNNRRLVLRKQPPGALLPSAHAVDREYRIISALAATDVPVPPTILFCTNSSIVGTPFYVMERVDGRIFDDCTLPGVSPADRRAMYTSMASTLAAFHNVDFTTIGLADFGKAGNYYSRQIARWARQWDLSRTRDDVNIDRLIRWLPDHIPSDNTASLVHGDYRVGNIIFHPDEPRVVALLDWELSTLGHPLADLAHSAMAWLSLPEEYGGLLGRDLERLGIPDLETYKANYAATVHHCAELTPFHMAFALFRWAVIFEGIAARARAGNASSENAVETGLLAAAFAKRAAELI